MKEVDVQRTRSTRWDVVATLALARDQDKGVASVRAYK
jgi:hypothetical protein